MSLEEEEQEGVDEPSEIYGSEDGGNQEDGINLISQVSIAEGTSNWLSSIFLVVNAALGAGLLNFPEAFDRAGGIIISMIVQVVLLLFAVGSLMILAYCAKKHSCSTYQEVVLRTCGRRMERFCSVFIVLYTFGTCTTFIVIIGDLSDRTLSSLYDHEFCHHWFMTRQFIMTVIAIGFILPLCFPKQIDFLKYPSSVGVFAVFYLVGIIVYEYYFGKFPVPDIRTSPDHWFDVLTVVPVICFGYQCHVSAVPIYACLDDKRVSNFSKTIFSAIIICALVYSLAGCYGYLTFGSRIAPDILLSYDAKSPIVMAGLIALGLKIITTYPILMFCGRLAIEDFFPKFLSASSRERRLRRIVISFSWFTISLLVACVVPNINLVISCIGSVAALFIFVFPAISLMMVKINANPSYDRRETQFVLVYAVISVAIGTFIFTQVLSESVWKIINGSDGPAEINLCD